MVGPGTISSRSRSPSSHMPIYSMNTNTSTQSWHGTSMAQPRTLHVSPTGAHGSRRHFDHPELGSSGFTQSQNNADPFLDTRPSFLAAFLRRYNEHQTHFQLASLAKLSTPPICAPVLRTCKWQDYQYLASKHPRSGLVWSHSHVNHAPECPNCCTAPKAHTNPAWKKCVPTLPL